MIDVVVLERKQCMTYLEFLREVRALSFEQVRTDTDEFLEAVITVDRLDSLNDILLRFFGQAVKPAGIRPSRELLSYTVSYGGIRQDQTLFYVESEENLQFAMLWPWSDGDHVTVKVIKALKK
jgi:hypothetical protein